MAWDRRMRALVVSANRLAGQGLQRLANRAGINSSPATLQDAATLGRQADVTLLYADEWNDDTRHACTCLRANRVRFVTIVGAIDAVIRGQALQLGALQALGASQGEDLTAVLRNLDQQPDSARRFALANTFVVDLSQRRVQRAGRFFDLGEVECKILAVLRDEACARPSAALALPRLGLYVYGSRGDRAASTVRVHIHQIRGKVEVAPDRPDVLVCDRGHGYRLRLARLPATAEGGDRTARGVRM
jgi:DNA-binding response OmpR family regulator